MLSVNGTDPSDIKESKPVGQDVDDEFPASESKQLNELRRKILLSQASFMSTVIAMPY